MTINSKKRNTPADRWSDHLVIGGDEASGRAFLATKPERAADERSSFEIRNVSGKVARGIEIELAGFGAEDVFHAYYLNRHGTPGVVSTPNSICVRFESLWRAGANTLSQTSRVHATTAARVSRPIVWEFALYGGGSERFCLEMSTRNVSATYRWLVATGASGNSLVADNPPAMVHDARICGARTRRSGS